MSLNVADKCVMFNNNFIIILPKVHCAITDAYREKSIRESRGMIAHLVWNSTNQFWNSPARWFTSTVFLLVTSMLSKRKDTPS